MVSVNHNNYLSVSNLQIILNDPFSLLRYEIAQKERKRSVGKIVNERDVIGRQLIDKQLEIRLLGREKDSLQHDSQGLRREIDARYSEMSQLRQQIGELNRERDILARRAIKVVLLNHLNSSSFAVSICSTKTEF